MSLLTPVDKVSLTLESRTQSSSSIESCVRVENGIDKPFTCIISVVEGW